MPKSRATGRGASGGTTGPLHLVGVSRAARPSMHPSCLVFGHSSFTFGRPAFADHGLGTRDRPQPSLRSETPSPWRERPSLAGETDVFSSISFFSLHLLRR